ncbi:amidohydrolase family protein [Actinomyces vulturis]|uniref:amidohydrolase family protein n=1 Tax=Actinomyces vulturis TaxID=1857645 RepID=UPI000830F72D|nr:amidohydrolase family protein [Actinomyces vulturis]
MSTWLLSNVRLWGEKSADVVIDGESISHVIPRGAADSTEPSLPDGVIIDHTVDGQNMVALPGFANVHAHADKSWWGLPWQSWGGGPGLDGRISWERERRGALNIPSAPITTRVMREFLRHGTTSMRSHIDVDLGIGLAGIDALEQSVAELDGAIRTTAVAFPQDGVLRRDGVADLLRKAGEREIVSHIGGLDPGAIDRDPHGQLDLITGIAAEAGKGVDIHLHDEGTLGALEIELLCDFTEQRNLQGKVTIAHGFGIVGMDPSHRRDVLERMGVLGMSMTTVAPLRMRQFPLAEFDAAGVRFGFGTDGIRDLWAPYGDGDILSIAWQYGHGSGVVRDETLRRVVEIATVDGAAMVSHDPLPALDRSGEAALRGFESGSRADVVLIDAENALDALVRRVPRHTVIAGGRMFRCEDLALSPWE